MTSDEATGKLLEGIPICHKEYKFLYTFGNCVYDNYGANHKGIFEDIMNSVFFRYPDGWEVYEKCTYLNMDN